MDVNTFRRWMNAAAESVDAWRIVPRAMIMAYGYLTWKTWEWYTGLEAVVLKSNCQLIGDQIICDIIGTVGPSTQQAALMTAVVSMAAVVIGLYSNSGKDWTKPLIPWKKSTEPEPTTEELVEEKP